MEIAHDDFFLNTLGNATSFLRDPGIPTCSFFNKPTAGNSMSSTLPLTAPSPTPSPTPSTVWIFSGITQYIWTEQPNLQKKQPSSGAALNSHTFTMETHSLIIVSIINRIAARCLCFRSVTEGFCYPLPKLSKCSHDLLLLPKQQFSNEKNWYFEKKLYVSRDVQKQLFDLCMSQIVTVLAVIFTSRKEGL